MYEGPGMYRHYKGGHYLVLGLAVHESEGTDFVVYVSMDPAHQGDRMTVGRTFVARPLERHDIDAEDLDGRAFNEPVEHLRPRFKKVA